MRWKLDVWRVRPRKVIQDRDTLRRVSVEVTDFGKPLHQLIKTLYYTLQAQQYGMKLGMAAPQIGVRQRVFITHDRVYVNPSFQPSKAPLEQSIEGCYSCCEKENETYLVHRAPYGWMKWQDTKGGWHEEKVNGKRAIIFQHELGHLDGKIISDEGTPYVPPKEESSSA